MDNIYLNTVVVEPIVKKGLLGGVSLSFFMKNSELDMIDVSDQVRDQLSYEIYDSVLKPHIGNFITKNMLHKIEYDLIELLSVRKVII